MEPEASEAPVEPEVVSEPEPEASEDAEEGESLG